MGKAGAEGLTRACLRVTGQPRHSSRPAATLGTSFPLELGFRVFSISQLPFLVASGTTGGVLGLSLSLVLFPPLSETSAVPFQTERPLVTSEGQVG